MTKRVALKKGYCIKTYDEDGELIKEEYFNKKKELSREDGAAIKRYSKGVLCMEEWYVDNEIKDGISQISYHSNGQIKETLHYYKGKIHSSNGPAFLKYDEQGNVIDLEYWINNKLCSKNFKVVQIDNKRFVIRKEENK